MSKGMQAPVEGAINYIFGLYQQNTGLYNREIRELYNKEAINNKYWRVYKSDRSIGHILARRGISKTEEKLKRFLEIDINMEKTNELKKWPYKNHSRIIIDGKSYRFSINEIAGMLGCHYNTVSRALDKGESHQYYKKIITAIVNKNREAKVL